MILLMMWSGPLARVNLPEYVSHFAEPDSVRMDIWVKGYEKVIPFDPDIHPDRIGFGSCNGLV